MIASCGETEWTRARCRCRHWDAGRYRFQHLVLGIGHRRAQSGYRGSAQRTQPLRRACIPAATSGSICAARHAAKPGSRHRDRRSSDDQPRGRRQVAMEVDEFDVAGALLGRRSSWSSTKTIVSIARAGNSSWKGKFSQTYTRMKDWRVHRVLDRPFDRRVRRKGDHLAQQADLRHHSVTRRASAVGTLRQGGACAHAPQEWCRTSRH